VLLLGLVACGSPSAAAANGADSSGVTAAELCSFMKAELPDLAQEPNQYSAMMSASSAISKLYEEHGALTALKLVDLDQITAEACPEVRKAMLKAIGQKSLKTL
jgi:hypothetical protein